MSLTTFGSAYLHGFVCWLVPHQPLTQRPRPSADHSTQRKRHLNSRLGRGLEALAMLASLRGLSSASRSCAQARYAHCLLRRLFASLTLSLYARQASLLRQAYACVLRCSDWSLVAVEDSLRPRCRSPLASSGLRTIELPSVVPVNLLSLCPSHCSLSLRCNRVHRPIPKAEWPVLDSRFPKPQPLLGVCGPIAAEDTLTFRSSR